MTSPSLPLEAPPEPVSRRAEIGGVAWTYTDAAPRGAPPLLVLPGVMGAVDGPVAALARLAERRRVIALAYPPVETMTALCDGIAALLDGAGIARVDVLGSSLGGWVAQCLARRHPERVRHLVLTHTFVLRPGHARRIRVGTRLWKVIPPPLFRALLRARLRRTLEPLRRAGGSEHARWMERVRTAPAQLTPAVLERYNAWMLESLSAFRFAPGDLARHPGRVLIVDSDDDPILRPADRAALRALYPAATVRTFRGTGHATPLVAPEEYAAAVEGFLDEAGESA